MRVLVTGAAGSIGQVLVPGLIERGYDVTALDLRPGSGPDWLTVDCTDPAAVRAAFDEEAAAGRRPDGVVHLAGIPTESSLPDALGSHALSTAALLEAMLAHGVTRMVYASSNHAVGLTPRVSLLPADTPPRPDTFYGVGKVAAEAVLRLYADRHDLDLVACRIGSFLERPETVRELATWLSHGDCVRMVDAALTAPSPGFAVIYGSSANTRAWWDLAPGRALGYEPVDDAESHAELIEPRSGDAAEAAHVGGRFALPDLARPAFD